MPRGLQPGFWDLSRPARRTAELERRRRLREHSPRLDRAQDGGERGDVIERLAPESFSADPGLLTDWVVTGERILDSEGTHSWSLLAPDSSPDARWLPIQPYRFDDASFSMTFAAAPAGATPEAPAWAMMLIGFAGLGAAGHRRARKSRRPVRHFEGKSR